MPQNSNDQKKQSQQTLMSPPGADISSELDNIKKRKHESAEGSFQLSEVPPTLPCRDSQFKEIKKFLEQSIESDGLGSGIYLSGIPGTGKTATVRRVLWKLHNDKKYKGKFEHVEVNAMNLKSASHVYCKVWNNLILCFNQRTRYAPTSSPSTALKNLQALWSKSEKSSSNRKILVVILDEMDYLNTPKQTELYNLFDWSTRANTKLIIVGIANTMDLPERLKPRVRSRMGLNRIVFSPYSRQQVQEIIHSRIKQYGDVFQNNAVELCARKVAAVSGDIRRALQICARAVDFAKERTKKQTAAESEGDSVKERSSKRSKPSNQKSTSITANLSNDSPVIDFTVSMADINEAAKELFSSNYVDIIVNSTHQEKILLCALLHCQKVLKLSEVPLDRVFQHHQALCRSTGCSVVPEYSSFLNILGNISETRLVTIDSKISYSESKVRKSFTVLYLNTIADDVLFALSQDSTLEMVVSQIRESQ